jgi:hypothetical protein
VGSSPTLATNFVQVGDHLQANHFAVFRRPVTAIELAATICPGAYSTLGLCEDEDGMSYQNHAILRLPVRVQVIELVKAQVFNLKRPLQVLSDMTT